MGRFIDRTGQRFGRLVVIERAPSPTPRKRPIIVYWWVQCDCGSPQRRVKAWSLSSGASTSCGCTQYLNRPKTHGMSTTPIYRLWWGTRQRCENPNYFFRQDMTPEDAVKCAKAHRIAKAPSQLALWPSARRAEQPARVRRAHASRE